MYRRIRSSRRIQQTAVFVFRQMEAHLQKVWVLTVTKLGLSAKVVTLHSSRTTSSSPCKSIPFGVHPLLKSSALEPRSKTSTALVIRTIQSNQRREHSNGFRMEGPRAEKRENENYTGITTKRHKHERQIIKCEQSKHDQN